MKYETAKRTPSQFFVDALQGGGNSSMYCNCGRQHYASQYTVYDGGNDDNSIIDEALENQKKDPEGIIIQDDDFIYAKEIDGKTFVVDCPCNGLTRYEDFIWNNKDSIRCYLKDRIDQEFRWAQEQLTLNKLAGI